MVNNRIKKKTLKSYMTVLIIFIIIIKLSNDICIVMLQVIIH